MSSRISFGTLRERETITNLQCSILFQAVVEIGIVDEIAGFTFKDALAWASD